MPIFKIIIVLVILAAVVAGALYFTGNLKLGADGTVSVTAPSAPQVDANADDYTKGVAFFGGNDFDKAVYHLEKFVKENAADTRCAEARYKIAKSYDDRPNPDTAKALAAWREYRDKHPNDDTTRINQAKKRIGLLSGTGGD